MKRRALAGLALLLAVSVVGCAGGRANPLGPGDVGVTPSGDGFAKLRGTWLSTRHLQFVLVWYELRTESGSYSTTDPNSVFAAGAKADQQPGCGPALLDIPDRPNQKASMCVGQAPGYGPLQYTVNTNQADQPGLGWALSRGQTYYFRLCAREYVHDPVCLGEQRFTVP